MPRSTAQIALRIAMAAVCLAGAAAAQFSEAATYSVNDDAEAPPALIRSIQVVPGKVPPALEVVTTRPISPVITLLANPPRLVIDMPKAYLLERQRIAFRDDQIKRVRVSQFRKKPPVVRVVVDLTKPCEYGWDEAGNRLTIRLRPEDNAVQEAKSAPAAAVSAGGGTLAPGLTGVSGTVLPASTRLLSGSSITAEGDTAVLKLADGGEIQVCAGTKVTVTPSQDGRNLMLGLNTGAVEAHYRLESTADSIMTPDFRILLPGPGRFDFAVSADSRGNTCVRALPGDTAYAVVSELMGDGIYWVKPSEQVVFHSGRLALVDRKIPADCGCSEPSIPVMRTQATPPPSVSSVQAETSAPLPPGGFPAASPETASPPASKPGEVHVDVDAPLVFHAEPAPPKPSGEVATASAPVDASRPETPEIATPASAPSRNVSATPQPRHRGFFSRFRNAVASLF